jgi:hypothetical protein
VRRTVTAVVTAAAVVAVAAVVVVMVVVVWRVINRTQAQDGCTFGDYSTDNAQASTAATMVGVVSTRALPERAAVLVLAAGLQESKLRNIPAGQGDRDSIGVLQQRPSQGWGTPAELADVRYATGAFLDKLVKVRSWRTRDLAAVVQAVQISADASAYTQHEPQAQAMADALMGSTPRGVSCQFPKTTTATALPALSTRLARELPVKTPSVTAKTITVPGAGWKTAAWFVANAQRAGLETVDYNGWRWSRTGGWKARPGVAATAVSATQKA